MNRINKKLYHAVLLSVGSKYSVYFVQFLAMIVYARWFTPEQFGVLAAIHVFMVFFLLLGEVGLGPAIVNLKKMPPAQRDGVFTITLLLGAVFAGLFYLATDFLNQFYGRDDYDTLGIFICLTIFFSSASTIPTAMLRREKRFVQLAKYEVTGVLLSMALVVVLLEVSNPLYALMSRPLVIIFIKFLLSWRASAKTEFGRPMPGRHLKLVRPLLGFSLYQFGFNFINYFSRNLDNLLVGRTLGMASLGIYDKAYALMRYPLMLLTFAMAPAIQPVIREYADDPAMIERTHATFVRSLAIVGGIAGVCIGLSADAIVAILLGSQWHAVAPLLAILSVSIPIQVILSTSGGFYQAMNRTDVMFKCGLFSATVNVAAISFGIWRGSLEVLSWALVVSFTINFVQCYWMMYRHLFRMSAWRMLSAVTPGLILSAASCAVYLVISGFLQLSLPALLSIVFNTVIVLITAGVCLLFTGDLSRLYRGLMHHSCS